MSSLLQGRVSMTAEFTNVQQFDKAKCVLVIRRHITNRNILFVSIEGGYNSLEVTCNTDDFKEAIRRVVP